MWTKEITDMIINGVWATLYMDSSFHGFRILYLAFRWVCFWQSRIKKD